MLPTARPARKTAWPPLFFAASDSVKKIATRLATLAPRMSPSAVARESSSASASCAVPLSSFQKIVVQTQERKTSVSASQPTRTATDQEAPTRTATPAATNPEAVPTKMRRRASPWVFGNSLTGIASATAGTCRKPRACAVGGKRVEKPGVLQRVLEAAGLGFEPRLPGPEPGVLPLDDPATGSDSSGGSRTSGA